MTTHSTNDVQAEDGIVLKERCNVRARPSLRSEVIVQVSTGDAVHILEQKSVADQNSMRDWMRIQLPPTAKCYIHSKLVSEGVVTGNRVNVRSGPGLHFKSIAKLSKGQQVEVIGVEQDWLQIKPTMECSGWIASELVQIEEPIPTEFGPVDASPAISSKLPKLNVNDPQPVTPTIIPPSPMPPSLDIPRDNQGHLYPSDPDMYVEFTVKNGILRSVRDVTHSPGAYELLTPLLGRNQHRICYLETADLDLTRFEGKTVRVFGNQTWKRTERYPVLQVERIDPVW